ncbi:MAG TPA: macro domain-containing protein [Clostridiales bacterium]|nr:macro domain-containing protein [Clostridiales bacterium]
MPFKIIRNDITKVHADAIVNAANQTLLGGGGVDEAIHWAAGSGLLDECRSLGGCKTGQAKITKGYKLPARYVIHTVGPVWQGGNSNEEKLLADCYRNSLALAKEYELDSIAFPLISSGAFGYPKDQALKTAVSVIGDFLLEHEMTVYLVVYDKASFQLSEKLFSSIMEFIDDNYIKRHYFNRESSRLQDFVVSERISEPDDPELFSAKSYTQTVKRERKLEDLLDQMDETFSQRLLRLIDERDMTDAQTYKRANVDRRLFSKIRNDIHYKPSKTTAVAFAIALKLNLDETKDLLMSAGYALSHSSKFDIIIEFFIREGNYNIFEINEALFVFDQKLLGV